MSDPSATMPGMLMGDGLFVQAFEAMGWPIPVVKRVAAGLLLAGMVLFPVTFRHALMTYANKEAQVIVHRLQPLLHPPASKSPAKTPGWSSVTPAHA